MSALFPHAAAFAVMSLAMLACPSFARADAPFSFDPPGKLVPGSGKGRVDMNVYAPGIRFPIEEGPAFANSQVYGHGGGSGPDGTSQCDDENFSYPWHDNYCESRSYSMPLCPSGVGHQGQDIRSADCTKGKHWTVAVADGTITSIGSYSVYLTTPDGTRFDYLHMSDLQIKEGQKVKRGDRMGKVANVFGGTATTVHLHFNIHENVAGVGAVYVPPYLSIVQAYEALLAPPATDAGVDAAPGAPAKPPVLNEAPLAAPEDPAAASDDDGGCSAARGGAGSSGTGGLAVVVAALALGLVTAKRRRR
ncbi:MAG: hypothetical protein JWP97_4267 [Labilithrix sp.]|nr:hypothetical protein [Labilithrix sp.]